MPRLVSMQTVKIGNWLIKASSLDDQIMVFGYNDVDIAYLYKMFYNEDSAFEYMEKIYDKDFKIIDR